MKKMFLILLVFVFNFSLFGQGSYDGKSVDRGKIYLTDSEVIEGQYLVFSKDSLEYYMKNSQARNVLGLNQVTKVQKFAGHYGNTGMWIGGIAGCGIGVAVALGSKETERTSFGSGYIEETKIQTWPIYVFTAAGTLIGYFIGKGSEDWETVYDNSTALLKNFDINPTGKNGWMLSYNLCF